jgi:hypothetical protein
VHWLRARALRDRWSEELKLVGREMGWTVNFYYHQVRTWTDRREFAVTQMNLGAAAYAIRKIAMYQQMAATADRKFKGSNPNYYNDFT